MGHQEVYKVEVYARVRRAVQVDGMSRRQAAREFGVSRKTIQKMLAYSEPPGYARKKPVLRPKLGPWLGIIDQILEDDPSQPKKQRHTAKRIWERLRDELGAEVAETTVRDYVRRRRRELGLTAEAYCPQVYDPGVTAEVDWGEAKVIIAGVLMTVGLFLMRACFSGACFVMAFETQSQQAFFEGHVAAFEFFGGVFAGQVRYDNLKAAAKKTLKGRRRVENERFVAFRSHYLYEAWFTLVGIEGAHEKGGVEGEVGRFRRSHLVPVPEFGSLEEFNDQLQAFCIQDLRRTISGRSVTVGELLSREIDCLRPLPVERFPTWEESTCRVNQKSMVTVRRNHYSVPVRLVGLKVLVRVGAREITVWHDGREVARHPRLRGSELRSARLDHYLELLQKKPGALQHSLALRQEREQGRWLECFDQLWRAIEGKVGASEAARQMVDVLLLCREHDLRVVELAVRGALAAGAHDGRAVAVLIDRRERPEPRTLSELPERLAQHQRPEPELGDYDQLLDREAAR